MDGGIGRGGLGIDDRYARREHCVAFQHRYAVFETVDSLSGVGGFAVEHAQAQASAVESDQQARSRKQRA